MTKTKTRMPTPVAPNTRVRGNTYKLPEEKKKYFHFSYYILLKLITHYSIQIFNSIVDTSILSVCFLKYFLLIKHEVKTIDMLYRMPPTFMFKKNPTTTNSNSDSVCNQLILFTSIITICPQLYSCTFDFLKKNFIFVSFNI